MEIILIALVAGIAVGSLYHTVKYFVNRPTQSDTDNSLSRQEAISLYHKKSH